MMFGRALRDPAAGGMIDRICMTFVDPALRATRTTCPYCGVGCGVLATPDGNGGCGDSRAIPSIPPISDGCARKARRSAKPSASRSACCIR